MNPTAYEQVNSLSEVQRKVLCAHYGACLELAIERNWPGFSCSECDGFQMEGDGDPDWWNLQAEISRMILLDAGYVPRWIDSRERNQHKMEDFSCDRAELQ